MSRKHKSNPQQPSLWPDVGPPAEFARGYARKKHFAPDPDTAEASAVVRGALADALDAAFTGGCLGFVLWQADTFPENVRGFVEELVELARDNDRAGVVKLLRKWGLDVFQALATSLFPELYAGDPLAVGLVPAAGPERCGKKRVTVAAGAAKLLGAVARSA
jgi:hypothetical protein